jgi:hypothetical protein
VGKCTNPIVDEPAADPAVVPDAEPATKPCRASLYLPKAGRVVRCRACGHEYYGPALADLYLANRKAS